MSGQFSRSKGRREEQQLVLYLAKKGFKAERILRQYQTAGQPDVIGTRNNVINTFEMKSRQCSFKTIYRFFEEEKDEKGLVLLSGTRIENSLSTPLLAISRDIDDLCDLAVNSVMFWKIPDSDIAKLRVVKRLFALAELKQTADYLVIKDNNKPRLFIKYWL